ncbi:lipocalin [Sulfitobacter sp. HNIBRBA3233]|uniref:lipocalin n=1 Tax=Sulfitobacter marinivivus TaxID=3158558 RepID=UPI0032DF6751
MCAALLLAACNAPPDSAVETGPGYRDRSVPIGITSRYDEARFAGLWYVRAVLPAREAFEQLSLRQTPAGPALRLGAQACDAAGVCTSVAQTLETRAVGPGQYIVRMPDGRQRAIWVLWVDEGFRTAVLGNPDGTFAWIIDRGRTGGADRIAAAREILDFNGYKTTDLKVVK